MLGSACARFLLPGLVVAVVGCGGAGRQAEPPGDEGERTPGAERSLPPLEPAPAPRSLVVKLRVRDGVKLLGGFFEAAGLPLTTTSQSLFFPGLPRGMDGSLPIEAVVALRPEGHKAPFSVISFGVRELPVLLQELAARGLDVREGPLGNHFFGYEGRPCAVGRALGPSPARVVCATDAEGLGELLPYALTGLPGEELSDADFHLDVDLRPVRLAYGRQLRSLRLLASVGARQLHLDEPRFDRAISDMAVALADELAFLSDDLDELSARAYEERGNFHGNLIARFHGGVSWTEQTLDGWSKKTAAAPAVFDALPASASGASYVQPLPAEKLQGLRATLLDLIVGYAASEKWSKPLQARLEKVVGGWLYLETGASVQASGPVVSVGAAGAETLAPAWQLKGTQRPEAQLRAWLADAQALVEAPEFRAWAGPRWLPRLKRRAGGLPGVPGVEVYEWEMPPALRDLDGILAELDEKHRLGELRELTKNPAWSPYERGYLALTTVDGYSWLVLGSELERLAEPLRALRSPTAPRLRELSRTELTELRSRPAVAAGFFGLPLLVSYVADHGPSPSPAGGHVGMLEHAPNRGEAALTTWIEVHRGAGTELEYAWRAPQAFVTDLAYWAVSTGWFTKAR